MCHSTLTIYCFIDDFLKSSGHREDIRSQVTDAEVITIALTAMRHFGGNFEKSRLVLTEIGLIKRLLSRSRFSRRVNRPADLIYRLFHQLGTVSWKTFTSHILKQFGVIGDAIICVVKQDFYPGQPFVICECENTIYDCGIAAVDDLTGYFYLMCEDDEPKPFSSDEFFSIGRVAGFCLLESISDQQVMFKALKL